MVFKKINKKLNWENLKQYEFICKLMYWKRLCCTNRVKDVLPFPHTHLAYRFCDRYTKSSVAIEDGDADLDFCDLPLKVPRHQRLSE